MKVGTVRCRAGRLMSRAVPSGRAAEVAAEPFEAGRGLDVAGRCRAAGGLLVPSMGRSSVRWCQSWWVNRPLALPC